MPYLIISILSLLLIPIFKFILKINIKEVKKTAEDDELDKLTSCLPENIEVCKSILNSTNNSTVTIENSLDKKSGTSLYIVTSNKILIANLKNSFIRFQTIAHECIHASQNKIVQIMHFIFANIYKMLFWILIILSILKKTPNSMMPLIILIFTGIIYFILKFILEKDAIINSKSLAIEYLNATNKLDIEIIKKIEDKYNFINNKGVDFIKFSSILDICLRISIYSLLTYVIK